MTEAQNKDALRQLGSMTASSLVLRFIPFILASTCLLVKVVDVCCDANLQVGLVRVETLEFGQAYLQYGLTADAGQGCPEQPPSRVDYLTL